MSQENENHIIMPKATAVWLVENTALSFRQIAEFCGLHELEIQAIADGDAMQGMQGISPISMGQLTQDELDRCQKDPDALLKPITSQAHVHEVKGNKGKYTPRARRGDRPDAIAWLIKQYPMLTDGQIMRLVGTTKSTIEAIRTRHHWNMTNIKPRSPVVLGFCSQQELDSVLEKIQSHTPELSEASE